MLYQASIYLKKSDMQLSNQFNVPISKIKNLRNKILTDNVTGDNLLQRRREWIVKRLFGNDAKPGENYVQYFEKLFSELATKQELIMNRYYIQGVYTDDLTKKTQRYFRWYALQNLDKIVDSDNAIKKRGIYVE